MSLYPKIGDRIKIKSYKHDGSLHRVWDSSTLLQKGTTCWIVGNDQVLVSEADGREWKTKEPAICTFGKGQWFNTIGMLREDGVHYYCNIGSPYRWHNSALEYIDYDLDVRVFPDRTYMILDQDEYEEHRRQMGYPESVRKQIDQGLNELLSLIFQQKGPFEPEYVERWYERFLQYK